MAPLKDILAKNGIAGARELKFLASDDLDCSRTSAAEIARRLSDILGDRTTLHGMSDRDVHDRVLARPIRPIAPSRSTVSGPTATPWSWPLRNRPRICGPRLEVPSWQSTALPAPGAAAVLMRVPLSFRVCSGCGLRLAPLRPIAGVSSIWSISRCGSQSATEAVCGRTGRIPNLPNP